MDIHIHYCKQTLYLHAPDLKPALKLLMRFFTMFFSSSFVSLVGIYPSTDIDPTRPLFTFCPPKNTLSSLEKVQRKGTTLSAVSSSTRDKRNPSLKTRSKEYVLQASIYKYPSRHDTLRRYYLHTIVTIYLYVTL